MHFEIISVHGNRRVFELNDQLDAFTFGACREIQQRMLVESELSENPVEARGNGFRHANNCIPQRGETGMNPSSHLIRPDRRSCSVFVTN